MKIKYCMRSPVYIIDKKEPIQRARNLMLKHDISRLPVVDGDKLVGMVTKYDISNRLDQAEPEWRRRPISMIPIGLVMTEDPITIYPDASIVQVAEMMKENEIDGVPVERNGKITGIITSRDLLRFFSEQELDTKVRDIMAEKIVSVHRHHTIGHVLDEMNTHKTSRLVVYEDNTSPVGMITRSDLTFTGMTDSKDQMKMKNIKMTRKESTAGRKQYRYVKEVPLVAEDIMCSPIKYASPEDRAVDAAKLLVDMGICGLPVIENGEMIGFFSTREIVSEIARW